MDIFNPPDRIVNGIVYEQVKSLTISCAGCDLSPGDGNMCVAVFPDNRCQHDTILRIKP